MTNHYWADLITPAEKWDWNPGLTELSGRISINFSASLQWTLY